MSNSPNSFTAPHNKRPRDASPNAFTRHPVKRLRQEEATEHEMSRLSLEDVSDVSVNTSGEETVVPGDHRMTEQGQESGVQESGVQESGVAASPPGVSQPASGRVDSMQSDGTPSHDQAPNAGPEGAVNGEPQDRTTLVVEVRLSARAPFSLTLHVKPE